jgi:hypothetical protein
MHRHEEAIVRTFIIPEKRKRYLNLLGKKKRRPKVLDALNHFRDLDLRYCIALPSSEDVVAALRARGAPEKCYLISAIPELDGREMILSEAIEIIEFEGWGTLVGCIPGRLAYYYGEHGEQRTILEKRGS